MNNCITLLCIAYPLFAFSSYKNLLAPRIDGIIGNNIVYIILVCYALKLVLSVRTRVNRNFFFLFMIYTLYICFNSIIFNNAQAFYAACFIVFPMAMMLFVNRDDAKNFYSILKIIVVFCLIYALYVIFSFFSYNTIVLLTNKGSVAANYVTRHSSMLGSSITTSYYFLITIPMLMIGIEKFQGRWRKYSVLTCTAAVMAVVLEQSRISFAILGLYLIVYFFHYGNKIKIRYKVCFMIIILIGLYWILNNESLSRLTSNYLEGASTSSRFSAIHAGLNAFVNKPIFGSGLATYYKRLWNASDRMISLYGNTSLVDPHNVYVMILVEQGIVGFLLYFCTFGYAVKLVRKNSDDIISFNVSVMIMGLLLALMGGSQLINEMNFGLIVWTYLMILVSKASYKC